MADGVARAIDSRSLAVPHAKNAVVLALEVAVGQLASPHSSGAKVFVQPRDELDVVRGELILVFVHHGVDPAKRGPAVTADHRRCVQPSSTIGLNLIESQPAATPQGVPTGWLEVFQFKWFSALGDTLPYLPIVIPFALGTVIGGIDCTESAAAAGDEFPTGGVIGVEAFATLVASFCGGVIQTTPYIGHPAYKAMGGRAAYTLATAIFVGFAGVSGLFEHLYVWIPKPTVFPILIFIGLEITAQSFHATPRRHYPALGLACVPALAVLAYTFANQVLGDQGLQISDINNPVLADQLMTLRMLQNGFIVTSLLWASALAALIDRQLRAAAIYFGVCATCTLLGIVHSPLPDGSTFLVWNLDKEPLDAVLRYAAGYAIVAGLLLALSTTLPRDATHPFDDDDDHKSKE